MSNITVTIDVIKVVLLHFEKLGLPSDPLLRAAGIEEQVLQINNHNVSLGAFSRFFEAACRESGNPCLGFQVGDNSNLDSLGILGQMYRYSKSIREGSLLITKYLPVLHRVFNIYYEETATEVELVFVPATWDPQYRSGVKQLMELAMAYNRRGLQHATQTDISPVKVLFSYALTEQEKVVCQDIFQCTIHQHPSKCALVYRKEDCERPHIFYNPLLVQAFESYAKEQLARLQSSGEYYTTVKNCIINKIRNGEEPAAANIAQQIGLTENSLLSILETEGRSFTQILFEVRNEIALGYSMEETNLTGNSLTEAVIQAEEKERSRIAQELHDGVSGMLAAVKMHFSTLQETNASFQQSGEFHHALSMLDEASRELRKTAHNLMPEILLNYGLDEALRRYCQNLQHCSTAEIQYYRTGNPGRFSHNFELAVYRVAQELIHNAIRHASPKRVFIQVSILRQQLLLTIEDDGCGFDTNAISNGMGLYNLRNRVNALEGTIHWDSQPNKGTSVNVSFNISPLQSSIS